MTSTGSAPGGKGHPRGGLFCAIDACLLAAALASAACGPTGPRSGALPPGLAPDSARIPNPLAVYDELGLIAGDFAFPAVGRVAYLPGPADSTYAIFALSVSNSALRFRRADPGFLARYNVRIVVGDRVPPAARLETSERVRVASFRETARRDESVVFQGLLVLAPGEYPATFEVRDPASGNGLSVRRQLSVPGFGPGSVSAPLIVYRAEPRSAREEPPALIINPRATVHLDDPAPLVYREALAADTAVAVLELLTAGVVTLTSTDTLAGATPLHAAVDSIDPDYLAPGTVTLRARLPGTEAADSAVLVVGLAPDWIAADYEGVMGFLRYAGTPDQLDSLRAAPPRERARVLRTFWKQRDPKPETAANEFFAGYFRRIQDANNRFANPAGPGWLTDRGAVYVTLGPPDEVTRHLDTREGPGQSQVWLYEEDSLGFELRLVFFDPAGTGDFRLTSDSHRVFQEAVRQLYS
ncbi:MAG: GWxTD domain-containing protein [Gemmatimonadetes bacterium]|uniref:GWxTD domain-containing protein n=1 Tax=Candidatus Kutchimonas denitrificans TaxID=3056748 RepID=A0AAE5CC70_9BACT|nr:GWxTD domain-containing protein [Gemmatimonadota bacterium]NIR75300.1 GWxTD domain-containing protein [Candidatus Kutchimonas denitrificans]NIS02126.1 GWxTD domain-containing protein [Gemmatimonadota bacterium]NIT67951.1 GWxTD domain-containing protein [Gemmatimonadota bacterium]NIU53945.1 GWxTD domain-containing protein [Gemmatimonadota bacterium]